MQVKYQIYRLSAKSMMGYAQKSGSITHDYKYELNKAQTDKCKIYTATHEQDDNALFYQIMCQLHGEDFKTPTDKKLITDLSDIICIVDFEGIFDRNASFEKYADRLFFATDMVNKDMVFPLGTWLDRMVSEGRLSKDAYEKIVRGNAQRIFGL